MTTRSFDHVAAREHLAEQLAMILPGLMLYIRNNNGLEFTIQTGERPFRLVFSWLHRKRRPSKVWQEKIFAKVTELLIGTNLFLCPQHEGPKGEYIIDLRISNCNVFLLRHENDIEVPHFHNVSD